MDTPTRTRTRTLTGTPVVPGTGYGRVVRTAPAPPLPLPVELAEPARPAEVERLTEAAGRVAERLSARASRASGVAAEVLATTAGLARDRGLLSAAGKRVRAGADAATAVVGAVEQFAGMFRAAGGLMAERVTDLLDVRDRLVAELTGAPEPGIPTPDEPSVLVADDLAPADTAGLDPAAVVAIVLRLGGPTSHTAIIARQLGIPCVVACADAADLVEGALVLVDGATGEVVADPDPAQAQKAVATARASAEQAAQWRGPGCTRDGVAVDVLANVQDGASAREAAGGQAQGVGLFRTELCFLSAAQEPSVQEQADVYAEVLAAFAGRKVVVRTLDAGSDKPLAFAGVPDEANPALGVRGLRSALSDPGLLDRQLDAIALAATRTGAQPWVMAPMVSTVAEARFFAERVRARGLVPGVMVEVPSAALHADRLLRHVDFLSVGTNDLTQYTLAADRLCADLAPLTDPWQPALLALVAATAAAGRAAGKPVGVCGEAAADPLLACVLVGLGVTSLSAAPAALPAVGAALAGVTMEQCRAAAGAALDADDPLAGRAAARAVLAGRPASALAE